MKNKVMIRRAGPDDLGTLDTGLRALSVALGHEHLAGIAELTTAGMGEHPAFVGLLAAAGPALAGVALLSPLFSTTRGAAGVYVSDLWVAEGWRGRRLGERLLAAARDEGVARWGAQFLRLGVALENRRAWAFYERLGFKPMIDETMLTLSGARLDALERAP